jgi:hypothetical protein
LDGLVGDGSLDNIRPARSCARLRKERCLSDLRIDTTAHDLSRKNETRLSTAKNIRKKKKAAV